jgi:prepilin-type N-terminal cleavage/methylation domain-containing protein
MASVVKGFSVIELACALALGGVVVALTVPSMHRLAQDSAAVATHNDLRAAIAFARNQAVQLATPVSLCASADGRDCDADSDWREGWIAFTDSGVAGTVDGADQVLRAWTGPGRGRLAIEAQGAAPGLRFSSRGLPLPAGTTASWTLRPQDCTPGEPARRELLVNHAGAVRFERGACT